MKRFLLLAASIAAIALPAFAENPNAAADARVDAMIDSFEKRVIHEGEPDRMVYRLLKPKNYDAAKQYPLVLLLHGAGEGGGNNRAQLRNGAPRFHRDADQFPCFLVVPQMPPFKEGMPWGWTGKEVWKQPYHTDAEPSYGVRVAMEIVESIQKEFSIDPKRLYITGISMGGFATWDIITRHPGKFAAAVPVCGGGEPEKAAKVKDMAIWIFHGKQDSVIPVVRSTEMVKALEEAGGKPKYTEYPDLNHNSWDRAYDEPELLTWMFAQRLK